MNQDIMRALGFGKQVDAVNAGRCPICNDMIHMQDFRDDVSRREWRISGMCQKCQDDFFCDSANIEDELEGFVRGEE